MILEAARDHGIDLPGSFIVGDNTTDIESGRRAGVGATIQLLGSKSSAPIADHHAANPDELHRILEELGHQ